jgi:subtilisin family serine protease
MVNAFLATCAGLGVALACAGEAQAQRRGEPSVRRIERVAPPRVVRRPVEEMERRARVRQAEADAAAGLERDAMGRVFRSAEVLLATDDDAALAAARALGFVEIDRAPLGAAGLTLVTLRAPDGVSAAEGVALLRAARPQDAVDLNFIYRLQGEDAAADDDQLGRAPSPETISESAEVIEASLAGSERFHPQPGGAVAALIDGPLAPGAAPAGAELVAHRFAFGPQTEDVHAARVAQILARSAGGAGEGLTLLSADVVSPGLEGATADALARALDWAADGGAGVINVSLAGPPNAAVEAVTARLIARGHVIVAAAGNDGPNAPEAFPAAYPGVLAVTAVNDRGRVWRRANRGDYVDFSALGVRVEVEEEGRARRVSGTSYAAPVVAGAVLAMQAEAGDVAAEERLIARAADLGEPGRDPVYGAGLIEAAAPARLAER